MFIFAIIGMQEGPRSIRFEPRESRGLEEYQGFPFGGHLTVIIIFINTATIILSVIIMITMAKLREWQLFQPTSKTPGQAIGKIILGFFFLNLQNGAQ